MPLTATRNLRLKRQRGVSKVICLLSLLGLATGFLVGCPSAPSTSFTPDEVPPPIYHPEPVLYIHQDHVGIEANGNNTGDRFGHAIAVGDFNCDEHDDIAIGIPGENVDTIASPPGTLDLNVGAVAVLLWTSEGPDPEFPFVEGPVLFRDDPLVGRHGFLSEARPHDRFGSSLAVGDFDYDGCDDLAIGIPYGEVRGGPSAQGAFQIRSGHNVHPLEGGDEIASIASGRNVYGERLGFSLAVGDFDGNLIDDIAIGAPGSESETGERYAGRVYVCYAYDAGYHGIPTDLDQACHNFTSSPASPTEDYAFFGRSIAAGNFTNDWPDELAIGAPGLNNSILGRVFVRVGTFDGLRPTTDYTTITAAVPDPFERFGIEVATGNLQGDEVDELIVGASRSGGGRIDIFVHSSTTWGEHVDISTVAEESFEQDGLLAEDVPACESCNFGETIETGDFNGDGLDDIAAGVFQSGAYTSGYVAFRYGAPLGAPFPTQGEHYASLGQEPADSNVLGDQYGFAIAPIDIYYQDLLGMGFDDIAIAMPLNNSAGVSSSGGVIIARPTIQASGPTSGVYQATVTYDGPDGEGGTTTSSGTLRASLSQELDTVRLRMWVYSGTFNFLLEDCHRWAEEILLDYYEGDDIVPAGGYDFDSMSPPAFGGEFEIEFNIHGNRTVSTIGFDAELSHLDPSDGFWDQLHVNINSVDWVVDGFDSGSCPGFSTTELHFVRVEPAWRE